VRTSRRLCGLASRSYTTFLLITRRVTSRLKGDTFSYFFSQGIPRLDLITLVPADPAASISSLVFPGEEGGTYDDLRQELASTRFHFSGCVPFSPPPPLLAIIKTHSHFSPVVFGPNAEGSL